jgi:hypothetical protein
VNAFDDGLRDDPIHCAKAGDLLSRIKVIWSVQPLLKKYSAFVVGQIISTSSRHPDPIRGALRNVINAGWDAMDAAAS